MQLLNDWQCSFAVQTVVCDGIIGDVSMAVTVNRSNTGISMQLCMMLNISNHLFDNIESSDQNNMTADLEDGTLNPNMLIVIIGNSC